MAKRRMLSISIVETDKFYSMSPTAQALYLHLNLNADDDGVVDRVKLVAGQMRSKRKSYEELIDGGYILELEEGLVVITHWHQHNQIRKDRYIKGEYLERLSSLSIHESGRFIKGKSTALVDKTAPQNREEKERTEEYSKAKDSSAEHRADQERINIDNKIYIKDNNRVASLSYNEKNKMDSLSMQSLMTLIKLYFMKYYSLEDMEDFVDEYERLGWNGIYGPMNKDNYKDYIIDWME